MSGSEPHARLVELAAASVAVHLCSLVLLMIVKVEKTFGDRREEEQQCGK